MGGFEDDEVLDEVKDSVFLEDVFHGGPEGVLIAVSPSEVASGARPTVAKVQAICGAAIGEVLEELGGLSVVSDYLGYCVSVVDCLLGLGLTFDQDERYSVDEEDDVRFDVLVAMEFVLVGDSEAVILRFLVVDDFNSLALLPWSKGYRALVLQPVEELLVTPNIIREPVKPINYPVNINL